MVLAARHGQSSRLTSTKAPSPSTTLEKDVGNGGTVVDEVQDILHLPPFDGSSRTVDPDNVVVPSEVSSELHAYVARIASMYREVFSRSADCALVSRPCRTLNSRVLFVGRDNDFHNYEHAS